MRFICQTAQHFALKLYDGTIAGEICYEATPAIGTIKVEQLLYIEHVGVGSWNTCINKGKHKKTVAEIKIRPGGLIVLYYSPGRKKYKLKCTGIYKNRFVLCNNRQDEILSLLPAINWLGRGHEYVIQINEDYNTECSPLLILHAIHCANCYLGMLNGAVPALISI